MHFIFGSIAKLKVRSVLWIYVIFFVHFYLGSVNVLNNHLCVFKDTIWMWMPVMETKETVLQYPSQNSWLRAKLSYWILTTTCMEKMLEACFCRFVWSFLLFLYQLSSICHSSRTKFQLFVHRLITIFFQVFDITPNTKRHLWTKSGSQWNSWTSSCVNLSQFSGRTVEISFIAVRGSGPLGDIAIDNVQLSTNCPCRLFFFQNLFPEMMN